MNQTDTLRRIQPCAFTAGEGTESASQTKGMVVKMVYDRNVPCFFLGANSAQGFASRFDALYDPQSDWRAFILKGGPGSGKSTLMKSVAKSLLERGEETELIYCSSDPVSLDAVIFPRVRFCIADGTAPHVLEPQYPGACETLLNPGDCWDEDVLFLQRQKIFSLCEEISCQHRRARRYLNAAGSLLGENRRLALESLNAGALEAYAGRLGRRTFPKRREQRGTERPRFLSGFTPDGCICFWDTVSCYAKSVTAVEDEYGAAAPILLSSLRERALASGYDVIACYCPLFPFDKLDALIVPEMEIAFITENRFLKPKIDLTRTVHTRRFLKENIAAHRQRIRFGRRAAAELIDEAVASLWQARHIHDELEAIYKKAMDFNALDRMTEALINRISERL